MRMTKWKPTGLALAAIAATAAVALADGTATATVAIAATAASAHPVGFHFVIRITFFPIRISRYSAQ